MQRLWHDARVSRLTGAFNLLSRIVFNLNPLDSKFICAGPYFASVPYLYSLSLCCIKSVSSLSAQNCVVLCASPLLTRSSNEAERFEARKE